MSLLQSLKNAKRRGLQQLVEKAGRFEHTVDPAFDVLKQKFDALAVQLNELGSAADQLLTSTVDLSTASADLSQNMQAYYGQGGNQIADTVLFVSTAGLSIVNVT